MRRKLLITLALICSLSGLFLYAIWLAFGPTQEVRPYSYSWWVILSPTIRNAPTPGIVGEAKYFTRCHDGEKEGYSAAIFTSKAPKKEITRQIREYIVKRGFKEMKEKPDPRYYPYVALSYEKEYLGIELSIEAEDPGMYRVSLDEYY